MVSLPQAARACPYATSRAGFATEASPWFTSSKVTLERFSQILSRLSAGIISAKAPWRTIRSPASTRRIKPDDTCYRAPKFQDRLGFQKTSRRPDTGQTAYTENVLTSLELKDFAIVDELRVELSSGLNVLTGETGAGKSILIDALAILIGGRADSSVVRAGAESALVQGLFLDAQVESLSRRVQAAGRSSARRNGELAEAGGALVAIFGQHAAQTLLAGSEQRKLLDRLLGETEQQQLSRYRDTFRHHQAVIKELEMLHTAARERARRSDVLAFQVKDIDDAKLNLGEDERLRQEADGLRHAERIRQGVGGALQLLSEAEPNALTQVAQAIRELESAARYHHDLAVLAGDLRGSLTGLQAVGDELASFLAGFEADPGRLEALETRLSRLEALKAKYGDSLAAVLAYRAEAAAELAGLQHAEEKIGALEALASTLQAELAATAQELSQAREKAAARLQAEVSALLGPLGMLSAVFQVSLTPQPLGPHGRDRVALLFSANLGEAPAPLTEVASGGELSRLMLALNVVTGSDSPTLAFDEVDAGIGGQAARAVGELLKRLARDHQVLVVTHLPQVAAYADAQFFVAKLEQAGRTVTRVTRLAPAEREVELARMLSGAVTDKALAHARELLSASHGELMGH